MSISTASFACTVCVASLASRWTIRSVSSAISASVGRRAELLGQPSSRALPWVGDQEDLERRIRKDGRAHVAAVHDHVVPRGRLAHELVHPVANPRHLRDLRHVAGHVRASDLRLDIAAVDAGANDVSRGLS